DADGVVAAELLRQLELGADAVGARNEHRLAVLARQVEQRAEAAQPTHHLGTEGPLHQRLDAFDDFIACVDVDAGVTVGQRSGAGHDGSPRGKTGILAASGPTSWTRRRGCGTIPA